MNFEKQMLHDARLVILRELGEQPYGTLNETLIGKVLDAFGYHGQSREWMRTQLRKMAEVGAIRLSEVDRPEADPLMVATITREGIAHLERRTVIDGIARPSRGV